MSETSPSTWLGGAQRGNLWLCCAEPLAEKRKSEISGRWHSGDFIADCWRDKRQTVVLFWLVPDC